MELTSANTSIAVERLGLARDELAGRIALVTGAGRGIGREAARALAWLGAAVVIAELSDEGAETERLIHEAGGRALFTRADVSDEASVADLLRRSQEAFGAVDILVNNAVSAPVVPFLEMDVQTWERVMAVNLRGTFLTCRAFLPGMIARGQGVIINMVTAEAMPGMSAYIASKRGITGLSQSLAMEVGGRGIRVIALLPGMVDTPAIRATAGRLAPLLGISEEQYLAVSFHPAYAGMMPADHAGAATAYLAARMAEEAHGEVVDGYEVLERAGLIVRPVVDVAQPESSQGGSLELVELARKLSGILEETAAEFERFPIFVRPMARAGFKSKAGMSLQDWSRWAKGLVEALEKGADGREAAVKIVPLLPRLAEYYRGVPGEMARFTKDEDALKEIARVCEERARVVEEMMARIPPSSGHEGE